MGNREKYSKQRVVEVYEALAAIPITRASAGKMFEILVLAMLCNVGGDYPLEVLGRSDSHSTTHTRRTFTIDPYRSHEQPKSFNNSSEITHLLSEDPGKLLRPTQANFPSVDAVVFSKSTVYLFQATIEGSHKVKVQGLEAIGSAFAAPDSLQWVLIVLAEEDSRLRSAPVNGNALAEEQKEAKWETRLSDSKYILKVKRASLFQIPQAGNQDA